jgi:hypothetical protein
MNGRCARALSSWIPRATSSLPVPLSPAINTAVSRGATNRHKRYICTIRRLEPIIPGNVSVRSFSCWALRAGGASSSLVFGPSADSSPPVSRESEIPGIQSAVAPAVIACAASATADCSGEGPTFESTRTTHTSGWRRSMMRNTSWKLRSVRRQSRKRVRNTDASSFISASAPPVACSAKLGRGDSSASNR